MQTNLISVKFGELKLKELRLRLLQAELKPELRVSTNRQVLTPRLAVSRGQAGLTFSNGLALDAGEYLSVQFNW